MSSTRKFWYIKNKAVTFEYNHKPGFVFGLYIDGGGYNDDLTLRISFLWNIWISIGVFIPNEWRYGIQLDRNALWIYFGKQNEMGWKKYKSKCISFWWNRIPDFLFGKEYNLRGGEEEIGTCEMIMDAGDKYTVTMKRSKLWKARSRWFVRKITISEITPDRGIPHAGKGENSWDYGDDATFNMSTWGIYTVEEMAQKLKETCEKYRKKYGMPDKEVQLYPTEK